ncbi:hypothetical protein GPX89_00220 [Nocardia sp. ET3-3]|uniref:Uncharacterized protein n=1 Tax=Nocardia terrae TaxID=2675851 RepID=A0A7K1UMV5_9NOCA|nr:hypothetical protein [Nocardia terrae]MVU75667.1 hypothetical protein [Nocardia terrae]
MTVGAVREKPDAAREAVTSPPEGTPGLAAPGEMSPKVLAGLVIVSMGVVVALIGGALREGLNNPVAVEETGTPSASTTQPVKAPPPPAPAPAPAPAAPVQMPAPAPQTQQYVAPAAPVEVAPETAAAPPPPPPAPAPPSLPDILAPILPFLLPPPPPPPPAP